MELLRNRNSDYQIGYHIVWCIKYRRPVLAGQVADDVKELLLRIAKEGGFAIEQMEVMPYQTSGVKKTVVGWPSLESVVLRWHRRSHIRRNRQKVHRKPKGW